MTLRTRLTLAFLLVVLVPLLIGTALMARTVPALQDRQSDQLRAVGRLGASLVEQYCERARAAADSAGRAAAGSNRAVTTQAVTALVQRGLADGVRILDPAGHPFAAAGRLPTASSAECALASDGRESFVAVGLPLRTAERPVAGTAVAAFLVSRIEAQLEAAAGSGIRVRLLPDQKDTVVEGFVGDPPDEDQVAVSQPVGVGELFVAQPRQQGPNVVLVALSVVLGAAALASLIALLLARATTRPLGELGDAAARIAGGDLETLIPVRSGDEVGRLAKAFNAMTVDLRAYIGALQGSRDELRAAVARLGDTLSATHDLDRLLSVVLETAMAAARAQAGMVLLREGQDLVLTVGRGVSERGTPENLHVALGTGLAGSVCASGTPLLASGDLPARSAAGEPTADSALAVPLKSSGEVLGVVVVYDREDGAAFASDDLASVRTLVSQAAAAVDNVLVHREAQRLSTTDALTGLWNYRYFTTAVERELERAKRFGRPMALLMLDLDHFKNVNDTYGHQRGDAVLIELAQRVRHELRDVDTTARYGGEELVVLLPETDEEGAAQAAERLCHAMRRKPFGAKSHHPVVVTTSVGAAVFPAHGATSGVLVRRADEALYEAKRAGRDTWRLAVRRKH
ncbi:MAG TPA: diguanylate cyclase [Mycobacteriales bacterium]|nr:diguanylate cyclase [Mycobacteriales bacterium]